MRWESPLLDINSISWSWENCYCYYYYQVLCSHHLFVFDRARPWWGLKVWQISGDVKNKMRMMIIHLYLYMYIFYLFIYLFVYLCMYLLIYLFIYVIYLFIYLFIIYLFIYLLSSSFKVLKLRWISLARRSHLDR